MNFLKPQNKEHLESIVKNLTLNQFNTLFDFVEEIIDSMLIMGLPKFVTHKTARYNVRHPQYTELFVLLFSNEKFLEKLYYKLTTNNTSTNLYRILIWEEKEYITSKAVSRFDLKVTPYNFGHYGEKEENLTDILSLITRVAYKDYRTDVDKIYIVSELRSLLKFSFLLPDDFSITVTNSSNHSELTYSNEEGVFSFISNIEDMLKNNLVEFGKTNEKPLAKTLNLLKASSGILEFYEDDKKSNTIATDMLTRSFYYYYYSQHRFRDNNLDTLKDFITKQFNNQIPFFISRIFTSHLKKVRFDEYYTSQNELFDLTKLLINEMPKDGWVSFENILRYCKYRDFRFDFESRYKTSDYYMTADILFHDEEITDDVHAYFQYEIIFFEPILKAMFFYLASLGIVEIKYDKPYSPYTIKAKGLPYISIWDQLKYIKFTNLGLYTLGILDSYEAKKIEKKETKLKFDNYKPIITVDNNDTIMLAKLEPYSEKYDENRYILTYPKIFRDCKDIKSLNLKIDGFYNNIEKNPPKIFIDFFDEIKQNANMLKKDITQIVINLQNNKKLLSLFMTNKRLKELTIKAQGYKIIVSKDNLSKLTKIVKDNGFFIEF